MIPAYNKMRCAAFPFETGIHFRQKTDFFPEEDTTKSYSGFEPEPFRLQAEGHSHHTGWATVFGVTGLSTSRPKYLSIWDGGTFRVPFPKDVKLLSDYSNYTFFHSLD
ncbi:hypothetical protein TNCV_4683581 [Trichonephila clavipes]|nr:hypothetical protein TNCV_4683581 [Trichonephila clavipes]